MVQVGLSFFVDGEMDLDEGQESTESNIRSCYTNDGNCVPQLVDQTGAPADQAPRWNLFVERA